MNFLGVLICCIIAAACLGHHFESQALGWGIFFVLFIIGHGFWSVSDAIDDIKK